MFLSISAFVPGWQPPSAPTARSLSFPPPGCRCVKPSSGCHSVPFVGSTGLRVLQPPTAPGPLQPRRLCSKDTLRSKAAGGPGVCFDTHKRAPEDAPNALGWFPPTPEMVPWRKPISTCPIRGRAGKEGQDRALQHSLAGKLIP